METTEAVTEGTEDQNNNSEINATNYYGYMIAGVVILLLVIAAYFINFNFIMNSKPGGSAEWGAFGDFVGGIANPFLGFVTILLLISSLRLQVKELRESTQAVRQSAMELGLTRKFHANQETLQLRDNVRPQIDSEYKNRIAACEYLLNDDVYRGRSLKACIDKSPPSLFDLIGDTHELGNVLHGSWLFSDVFGFGLNLCVSRVWCLFAHPHLGDAMESERCNAVSGMCATLVVRDTHELENVLPGLWLFSDVVGFGLNLCVSRVSHELARPYSNVLTVKP